MDSPYNRKKYRKKNNKPKTSLTETQAHEPNENIKNTKNNKKNNTLKGGNRNDIHLSGREIIGQAFQNDKIDSILENKDRQEDNTKFITLARKMIDNN